MLRMKTVTLRSDDYGCKIPQGIIYWNVLLQRQRIVFLHEMHGKIKLKLENYRDEKWMIQTAWMTRTNENCKSESIQIKSIPVKSKKKVYKNKKSEWKVCKRKKKCSTETNVYEIKLYE